MNWVDQPRTSADERDVVCSPRCRDCVWAVQGLVAFPLTSRFFVNSQLDHSRAWIPACSLTSALLHRCFPSNLSTTTQGAIVKAAQASNCSGVCWEEGIGGGGVLVLQDVGTMKSLHWRCEMWFDCVERKISAKLPCLQRLLARSLPRRRSRRACVRSYVHFVYVCVYMCMCVCVRTCIYVYICMCVCICTCMRLYTCVCVCVCIFVHRLWVSVSVLQRVDGVMHAHVCSCAYVCVCTCV